jgi:hypothetical protein
MDTAPQPAPLSEAKRLLLEKRMRGEFIGALRRPEQPRPAEVPELSYAQQRIWVLERLEPAGAYYNLPLFVRIRGPLAERALEEAIQAVMRRHTALRSVFAEFESNPRLRILDETLHMDVRAIDLPSDASPSDAVVRDLALREVHTPFALERGPLVRAVLLRLGEDDRVLLLTFHTMVCDPWSMKTVAAEISALYEAFAQGRSSPLRPPAFQYADFVRWQCERWNSCNRAAQTAFWQRQLQPPVPLLSLPWNRPRPAAPAMQASRVAIRFPQELAASLDAFSRRNAIPPFSILLGGFMLLLRQWSGEEDILVGSAVSNLNWTEVEHPVGFLLYLALFRTSLSGSPTFREAIERVRRTCLDVYGNLDIPYPQIAAGSYLALHGPATSFPQFMFDYQTEPLTLPLAGCRTAILDGGNETTKFDLDLTVVSGAGWTLAEMKYSRTLFDETTVVSMLQSYVEILTAVASRPGESIPPSRPSRRPADSVESAPAPPESPAERQIAEIWSGVLGRGPIGATANFWDLGGNSLAAVRILQEILHVTGKALSPERFYRAPSIRQQAALVEEAATSAFGSHA